MVMRHFDLSVKSRDKFIVNIADAVEYKNKRPDAEVIVVVVVTGVVGCNQRVNEKSRKLPNKSLKEIGKEEVFKILYLGSYLRELTADIKLKNCLVICF